jgi:soluble lytic murein transglycosylase-like protein
MQPGYGVTNIFDLAQQRGVPVPSRDQAGAQQLLGNEQLNREFGQNYFNAMQQRFPGQPEASVAAYNAGPGRVGQNMQANAGQLNPSQLPNETQAYIQKVLNRAPQAQAPAPMVPQAPTQLAQEPPATPMETTPVAPTQLAQEPPVPAPAPASTQPMIAGMPSSDVGLTPTEQALQDPNMQRFAAAQKDPNAMLALAQDQTAPQWARSLAFKQVEVFAKNANEENKANQMTDPNAIAKELSKRSADGSWVKYYLMKRLGLNEAATQEASKLGLTNTWKDYVIDGKSYLINVQADGLPIAGIDPSTGKSVPASIYQKISSAKDYDIVGGTFVSDTMKDSQGNPMVGSLYRNKKNPEDQFIQTSEGKKSLSGFRPQGQSGSLSDMRAKQIQQMNIDLQGKTEEQKLKITQDYSSRLIGQGLQPVQPSEIQLAAPQISGGAPAPAARVQTGVPTTPTTPTTTQSQPQAQPQAQPVAPVAPVAPGTRPTMSQLEAQAGAQKKEAEIVAEDVGKVRANIGKIKENADYLTTKIDELITDPGFKYNVGVADIKGIPIPFGSTVAGLFPGTEATDFKARFDEIKGQQFLQGIEQLKGSGAITDREGAAAQKAISRMSLSQSEAEFKKAADDFQSIIKRGVDRSLIKAGQEPIYGTAPASQQKREKEKAAPGTKENPIKL